MLDPQTQIGATTQGTTFADIIINNVSAVADGMIQGFAQFVHDPQGLKKAIGLVARAAAPKRFAEAVLIRRVETQKLDDAWNFPLNMAVPNTCPIPWTMVESEIKTQQGNTQYEFQIMRTVDFVGRQYLRITLPQVDTSGITDSSITQQSEIMSDPNHIYLGAWKRDLIPHLIQTLSFYPRSNTHKLFDYSGYDIFIHNMLFGNCRREMNNLMAGEDKFELVYDPYRVDGSAMGLASYKGIDAWSNYTLEVPDPTGFVGYTASTTATGVQDGIIDYFQLDTTMDNEEFRSIYRHNVWYEAPVAQNYHARHSIHSRRMFHQAKEITIPLDILPFGYSIGASLPSAAISGECGFIKITLYNDWLDRAFYLTKVSDIPSLHPLVNHRHYVEGDTTPLGIALPALDFRLGWVNERSIGRYGDPSFVTTTPQGDDGFESVTKFTTHGNVLNAPDGFQNRENIVQTVVDFSGAGVTDPGLYNNGRPTGTLGSTANGSLRRTGNWQGVVRRSTTTNLTSSTRNTRLTDSTGRTEFIHTLSSVDKTYYNEVRDAIHVKLIQIGYQTMPCIREFLSKLPNIYISTEWNDKEVYINESRFEINNDLYIQAIVLWFIPTDVNGIESLRVYPCHMIDHEMPLIAGIKLTNEQSQGTTIYDWHTLNVMTPAEMKLDPLIENIGLLSFSPSISANALPLAYYDSNISGYLKADFKQGEGEFNIGSAVNLKQGYLRAITIGINGVALVNLNMFRLIF